MNVRKILYAMYGFLLLAACYGLFKGRIGLAFTTTLYVTLLLAAVYVVRLLNSWGIFLRYKRELHLVAFALLATLFVADVLMIHVWRPPAYITYLELNGNRYYYSNPLRQKFKVVTGFLRKSYVKPWYDLKFKPNSTFINQRPEFVYTHNYNSMGLRSNEIPLKKGTSEKRVVVLGDSFIEGVGAPQDSSGPALLQKMLSMDSNGDTAYNVINAGISGSDPFHQLYLLRDILMPYQPDVVVLNVNESDIADVIERGGFERFQPDSSIRIKESPWWEPFYGGSMMVRLVVRNILGYNVSLVKEKNVTAQRIEALNSLKAAVAAIQRLADTGGFKLLVVYQPMLYEVMEDDKNNRQTVAGSLGQNRSIHYLNLIAAYKSYFKSIDESPQQYYWKIDGHHNSKGYLLWARLVHTGLKPMLN